MDDKDRAMNDTDQSHPPPPHHQQHQQQQQQPYDNWQPINGELRDQRPYQNGSYACPRCIRLGHDRDCDVGTNLPCRTCRTYASRNNLDGTILCEADEHSSNQDQSEAPRGRASYRDISNGRSNQFDQTHSFSHTTQATPPFGLGTMTHETMRNHNQMLDSYRGQLTASANAEAQLAQLRQENQQLRQGLVTNPPVRPHPSLLGAPPQQSPATGRSHGSPNPYAPPQPAQQHTPARTAKRSNGRSDSRLPPHNMQQYPTERGDNRSYDNTRAPRTRNRFPRGDVIEGQLGRHVLHRPPPPPNDSAATNTPPATSATPARQQRELERDANGNIVMCDHHATGEVGCLRGDGACKRSHDRPSEFARRCGNNPELMQAMRAVKKKQWSDGRKARKAATAPAPASGSGIRNHHAGRSQNQRLGPINGNHSRVGRNQRHDRRTNPMDLAHAMPPARPQDDRSINAPDPGLIDNLMRQAHTMDPAGPQEERSINAPGQGLNPWNQAHATGPVGSQEDQIDYVMHLLGRNAASSAQAGHSAAPSHGGSTAGQYLPDALDDSVEEEEGAVRKIE